jgi:hypothetical protein
MLKSLSRLGRSLPGRRLRPHDPQNGPARGSLIGRRFFLLEQEINADFGGPYARAILYIRPQQSRLAKKVTENKP